MTQEEFDKATPEEWAAEVERCKDPVYFYNTYWKLPNGESPQALTAEQWEYINARLSEREPKYKRRNPRRTYPLTIEEAYLPEFIRPKNERRNR